MWDERKTERYYNNGIFFTFRYNVFNTFEPSKVNFDKCILILKSPHTLGVDCK